MKNKKAQKWIEGRKNWKQKLSNHFKPTSCCCWVHCASLGEFEQARPIIESLKSKFPSVQILLTFFSPSGYEVRKDYPFADYIAYLPLDSPTNANYFIQTIQPAVALFIKYEYWYYYLKTLRQKKIPCFLVAAIAHKKSLILHPLLRSFYQAIFRCYTCIFAQDEQTAQNLHSTLQVDKGKIIISGDPRFDRVAAVASQRLELPELERLLKDRWVLVAGSTWNKDVFILSKALKLLTRDQFLPALSFILVPHEVNSSNIDYIKYCFRFFPVLRYSEIGGKTEEHSKLPILILIVDKIGFLSKLYRWGNLCYVGGGFGVGVHNVLEAAVYGKRVLWGPNFQKSREAKDLISLGAAACVFKPMQVVEEIKMACNNPGLLEKSQKIAKDYCLQNQGATLIVLGEVEKVLVN
ncbi:MAG: glycosyltransferase N-terminal domain-containing protein [Bacteroidia bacterium]|nr:glycosyltransferase N-terminal domain-containing protein [Bacteroidia bacterium]